ncbi:hypothetical protein [Streptomyces nigrescens]|uniref:hypothetical protein n=1 Tax=Streptomyces nigrescens TaxID=1920 RepID=UPI00348DE2EC
MTGGAPLTGNGPAHALVRGGGGEGDGAGLLHHLLVDQAIKVVMLVALTVLGLGMALIWKKAGRGGPPRRDDG